MGYGGALIWTGLARNLKQTYPDKKIIFIYRKSLKDLFFRKPHSDHIIYKNNPDIFLIIDKLKWLFEKRKFDLSQCIIIDMDELKYHYWGKDSKEKIEFKEGKHAIQFACDPFGIEKAELKAKIVLDDKEKELIDALLRDNGLKENSFICIEPHANQAFTPNKAWLWERWQELADKINNHIKQNNLDIKLVQIGMPGGKILQDATNLTGKTSFRNTARILEKSKFFICYIGGLVHLSKAMNGRNIVLVSAWEPLELASYPDDINFYTNVDCKNCGLKIPCPYDRKCMSEITVNEVFETCKKLI